MSEDWTDVVLMIRDRQEKTVTHRLVDTCVTCWYEFAKFDAAVEKNLFSARTSMTAAAVLQIHESSKKTRACPLWWPFACLIGHCR